MAVTLKFQSSGMIPGDGRPVAMQGTSLTVGRGPANDLVLPDPDRVLSKNHFVIEDHNGNVVIVDLSTNGTFLNYSKIPLGRTPTPLNSGDVLTLGGYELIVEIGSEKAANMIADPLADGPVSHGQAGNAPDPLALLDDAGPGGDFLDDLLGAEGGPKGPGQINIPDPMDELLPPAGEEGDILGPEPVPEDFGAPSQVLHNPTTADSFAPGAPTSAMIPDDWDADDLMGGGASEAAGSPQDPFAAQAAQTPQAPVPQAPAPQAPAPQAQPPAAPEVPVTPVPEPAPNPVPEQGAAATPAPDVEPPKPGTSTPDASEAEAPAVAISGDQSAALAFIASLDVAGLDVEDEELQTTMARMGRVMRAMITGLREILMTRTSIKSEFRIDQTMIGAQGNNPLKFSISPDQAVEALVRGRTKGYLSAETATEEALKDIRAHEIAMVTGMEAALRGVLARLDPETLAGKIETSGALGSLWKGKKARYWEVYEKMYADISDQAENDFHDLFSREFARAYKEQLEKLK